MQPKSIEVNFLGDGVNTGPLEGIGPDDPLDRVSWQVGLRLVAGNPHFMKAFYSTNRKWNANTITTDKGFAFVRDLGRWYDANVFGKTDSYAVCDDPKAAEAADEEIADQWHSERALKLVN